MDDDRLANPDEAPDDRGVDTTLRPDSLDAFVGQDSVRQQLGIFLEAARQREEALDHVLLAGPPGLGKTSLAIILASEMGVEITVTSGPVLERKGDLAAILTALGPGDVLFIDEIHRLNRSVEEVLYPAMEDFQLDVVLGQGPQARTLRLDLPRFTLVGATTRSGLLTTPLRDRFGVVQRLDYYGPDDLGRIILRSSALLDVDVAPEGARAIAMRSRGTPRIANRLLRRVRPARGGRSRARRSRPQDPHAPRGDVLGQADGPWHAGRCGGGVPGHHRGRLRALPAAAGALGAHAPRTRGDAACLCAPGPRCTAGRGGAGRPVRR